MTTRLASIARSALVAVVLAGCRPPGDAHAAGLVAAAQAPAPIWTVTFDWRAIPPAVVDGIVYSGSVGGDLVAFDAQSGAERWRSAAGEFYSKPAVVDGVIYVGGTDHYYALDADDGAERWRFETESRLDLAPPVVENGIVAVCDTGSSFADEATVIGLDAATGEELWRQEIGEENRCTPHVAHGRVFVCDRPGTVYAFDLATGDVAWETEADPMTANGSLFCPGLAVDGDGVYAVLGPVSPLIKLDAATGDEVWEVPASLAGSFTRAPVVDNGIVFGVPGYDGKVIAVDAESGRELWRRGFGVEEIGGTTMLDGTSGLVLVDGLLYAGLALEIRDPRRDDPSRGTGAVAAVDPAGGDEQWRVELDGLITGAPEVVDGTIYVGTDRGTLLALR